MPRPRRPPTARRRPRLPEAWSAAFHRVATASRGSSSPAAALRGRASIASRRPRPCPHLAADPAAMRTRPRPGTDRRPQGPPASCGRGPTVATRRDASPRPSPGPSPVAAIPPPWHPSAMRRPRPGRPSSDPIASPRPASGPAFGSSDRAEASAALPGLSPTASCRTGAAPGAAARDRSSAVRDLEMPFRTRALPRHRSAVAPPSVRSCLGARREALMRRLRGRAGRSVVRPDRAARSRLDPVRPRSPTGPVPEAGPPAGTAPSHHVAGGGPAALSGGSA